MSVVVVVVIFLSELCGLWCVQIILCKVISFKKEFFGELIVLRNLIMNFTNFFNVILSDLSKLSLSSFQFFHNCEAKNIVAYRH